MQPEFEERDQEPGNEHSVKAIKRSKLGFAIRAAVMAMLLGGAGCVYGPPHAGYAESPPVYVDGGEVVQDDYVYYPRYEVYYSNYRHQYLYRDGRSWVSRPAPPRVSAEVLFTSPSVRLDFHGYPANPHTTHAPQGPTQA